LPAILQLQKNALTDYSLMVLLNNRCSVTLSPGLIY
jgi:hypothetical protein